MWVTLGILVQDKQHPPGTNSIQTKMGNDIYHTLALLLLTTFCVAFSIARFHLNQMGSWMGQDIARAQRGESFWKDTIFFVY